MLRYALRLLGLLAFAPALAHAWGNAGHRIVAELAEQRLSPTARAEVHRLLAATRDRSLADVATWADDLRDDPPQHVFARATAPLHYVNFSTSSCRYDPPRDCPGGRCVVAAIERYARVLGDRSRSDTERAEALRFVVHFVADAHQPLHAGYRRDKGGNRYQVQLRGRGTNLHAVWDTPVLANRRLGWRAYATRLARAPLPAATGTPAQWAEESCRATRDDGIYPHGHAIDDAYLARMRPLAERRVRLAAARLATLLNRELGAARRR
ncbi:S1/P1 nuclease [Dokdonella soli]